MEEIGEEDGAGGQQQTFSSGAAPAGAAAVADVPGQESTDKSTFRKTFAQKFAGIAKANPITNAIKKKRTNFRLRKILVPKSPLMVLHEMTSGAVTFSVTSATSVCATKQYQAQCIINGETFTGVGPSKQMAKNTCAERGILAITVKKSLECKNKGQMDADGNPLKPNQMEDETPWSHLSSVALFKLFSDWQAQGMQIPEELWRAPEVNPGPSSVELQKLVVQPPQQDQMQQQMGQPKAAKKLPENPTERHPVQLLNEIRGGIVYNLVERLGSPPNTVFVLGAEVEGRTFNGMGKNKKDAKKNCAMEILKHLHNIVYPESVAANPVVAPQDQAI